jgi:GTP-binding protein EngB required for normal cell division
VNEIMNFKELIGVVLAGLTAGVVGAGRSHMKVRDRLQNTEVRVDIMEDKTDKLEDMAKETHESVIRLEMGVLGIEDDIKTSIRRSEKIQKTINSIERMFKLNGNGTGNGDTDVGP